MKETVGLRLLYNTDVQGHVCSGYVPSEDWSHKWVCETELPAQFILNILQCWHITTAIGEQKLSCINRADAIFTLKKLDLRGWRDGPVVKALAAYPECLIPSTHIAPNPLQQLF